MSKSLGNFITIREALSKVDAEVLRFYFLMSHYRSPIDFEWSKLEQARSSLEYLYGTIQQLIDALTTDHITEREKSLLNEISILKSQFLAAMDNDFNTPEAIATLFSIAREVNKVLSSQTFINRRTKEYVLGVFRELGGILGILQKELRKPEELPFNDLVQLLIEVRDQLRRKKQYDLADKIRENLKNLGIVLEDTATGTRWKRISSIPFKK